MRGFACLLASCRRLLPEGIGEEKLDLLTVVVISTVRKNWTGHININIAILHEEPRPEWSRASSQL